MDRGELTRHSKFLSLVLRPEPETIDIQLDEAGWVSVDKLRQALANHGKPMSREILNELVATNSKKRFAFSDEGTMIRASQRHSVGVELELPVLEPPSVLYHGTVAAALPSIRSQGLTRQQRHHVHLSADIETAKMAGGRRGKPVILEVNAGRMHAAGHQFYRSENGVWLTDAVPAGFFRVMPHS